MENNEIITTGKEEINTEWIIYILIWFFLGTFGVHRFVAGKIGSGIGMLALTVFGFILSIILVGFLLLGAVGIWWLVDGIMILMGKFEDSKNNPIKMKKTIS